MSMKFVLSVHVYNGELEKRGVATRDKRYHILKLVDLARQAEGETDEEELEKINKNIQYHEKEIEELTERLRIIAATINYFEAGSFTPAQEEP